MAQQNQQIEPFSVRNLNPFILVYGLPSPTSASLLPTGESSLELRFDISNYSKTSTEPDESIILDGETYRATLIFKQGIADGWQVGVELPIIAHSSGIMDRFIEGWHDIFGLSNTDRDSWPSNRLLLRYTSNGNVTAEMSNGSSGVGDIQLQLSRPLATSGGENRLALNASLKLATGDAEQFHGSGSNDLAFWLNGAAPTLSNAWRIGGYWQAGILLLGEGKLIPGRQRDRVWFGTAGLHWRARDWLTLKTQFDAHGSFYDSRLDQLGKRSVMLTVGGSIPLERGSVDLSVGENLATDTVPDFTINLAYRLGL